MLTRLSSRSSVHTQYDIYLRSVILSEQHRCLDTSLEMFHSDCQIHEIDLMHNDVILWSRHLKSFEMATLECFENLIWLKITIRTNKLEYLLYN